MPVSLTAPIELYAFSVAACAALALWAWFSYKTSGWWVAVIFRALLALLVGPLWLWQLMTTEVQLDRTTIRWTTGLPWDTQEHSVDLAGLDSVVVTQLGSGRNRSDAWVLIYRDGTQRVVPIIDVWRANQEQIADYFLPLGIRLPR